MNSATDEATQILNGPCRCTVIETLDKGQLESVFLVKQANGEFSIARVIDDDIIDEQEYSKAQKTIQSSQIPYIVANKSIQKLRGKIILFEEHANLGSLEKFIRQRKEPTPENVVKIIARQIFEALNLIHSTNLFHRPIHSKDIVLKCEEEEDIEKIDNLKDKDQQNKVPDIKKKRKYVICKLIGVGLVDKSDDDNESDNESEKSKDNKKQKSEESTGYITTEQIVEDDLYLMIKIIHTLMIGSQVEGQVRKLSTEYDDFLLRMPVPIRNKEKENNQISKELQIKRFKTVKEVLAHPFFRIDQQQQQLQQSLKLSTLDKKKKYAKYPSFRYLNFETAERYLGVKGVYMSFYI
ncbi:MAG: hypothetical protein EZS28_004945 [Streblomastix strix]|uniref:Protein kinase domain-containing protein n=1 Tax=Streblomastix strix TaxID=222440 RepID=A0A5J4WXH1_9EUKA|nr:MAG: hypothetical protein EZS28_004945 [Streblomastix strix]